jgi:hypothetical protein
MCLFLRHKGTIWGQRIAIFTVEPRYNDISLQDISSITSDILWYLLIPHC